VHVESALSFSHGGIVLGMMVMGNESEMEGVDVTEVAIRTGVYNDAEMAVVVVGNGEDGLVDLRWGMSRME